MAAGTSDLNIATEAKRTLEFFGYKAEEIYDVGVAGLWRIMKKLDLIKNTKLSLVAKAGFQNFSLKQSGYS